VQASTIVVLEGDETGQELLEASLRVLAPDVLDLDLPELAEAYNIVYVGWARADLPFADTLPVDWSADAIWVSTTATGGDRKAVCRMSATRMPGQILPNGQLRAAKPSRCVATSIARCSATNLRRWGA
jgi:hypothetical protein